MIDTHITEQFEALRELMVHAPSWLDVYDNEIGAKEEDKKALERAQKAVSDAAKQRLCHFCSLPVDLSKGTVSAGGGIAHLECALDPRRPNRSDNPWIPVSEQLPDDVSKPYLVLTNEGKTPAVAHRGKGGSWFTTFGPGNWIPNVTHWMDLPEPPKPADPFEAWWWLNRNAVKFCMGDARLAWDGGWDAAKEHYAKPLPDFETWWDKLEPYNCRVRRFNDVLLRKDFAQAIWNAAQGKPEA